MACFCAICLLYIVCSYLAHFYAISCIYKCYLYRICLDIVVYCFTFEFIIVFVFVIHTLYEEVKRGFVIKLAVPFSFIPLGHMFIITFLFPNSLMLGFEFFEENEQLQFNEFNLYLLFFVVAYRWRNDGEKIKNLEL